MEMLNNDKDKDKKKEITLPADFVDGRKHLPNLHNLAAWATDHDRIQEFPNNVRSS